VDSRAGQISGLSKICIASDTECEKVERAVVGRQERGGEGLGDITVCESELHKITKWAKNYKADFKDEKPSAMLVSRRKRKERKDINIFLNSKRLKEVEQMKYLGIIMDSKFKFSEHITYAAAKTTKLRDRRSKSAKL
jgi:hypothetical protein